VRFFKKMRIDAYLIVLFFLWLPSEDMAVARVKARVRQGGHNVPELVVRRRYGTGLSNFFQLYWPLSHIVWLLDGSEFPPKRVAYEKHGILQTFDVPLFQKIGRSAQEKSNVR
jgi:predicted ABC-type ATPase